MACLTFLADIAPGSPEAEELVLKAYAELWDVVGKGRAPVELLKQMSEGDPFVIPQRLPELESLTKRLKELRELVEQKGWFHPSLVRHLQQDLLRQAAAIEGARRTVDRTIRTTTTDFKLKLSEEAAPLAVSPDGRWIVKPSLERGSSQTAKFDVYDTVERKQSEIVFPTTGYNRPVFTPDGKELVVVKAGKVTTFPFRNGSIDATKARSLEGIDFKGASSAGLRLLGPQNFLVHTSTEDMALVDGQTGKAYPINVKPHIPAGHHVAAFDVVPGKNQVMLHQRDAQYITGDMKVFDVLPDGSLRFVREIFAWKDETERPGLLKWLNDGREVRLLYKPGHFTYTALVAGNPTPLVMDPPKEVTPKDFATDSTKVKLHPTRAEAVVIYVSRGLPPYLSHVAVYDLENGKLVGSFPGPTGWVEDATFTGDGGTLVFDLLEGDYQGLSYESRINR